MPTLWEAESLLANALETLSGEGVSATDEDVELIRSYVLTAKEKRDGCAYFLRQCEEQEDAIGREIERLEALKLRRAKARQAILDMIRTIMEATDIRKVSGVTSSFTLVQSEGPVVIPESLEPESADPRFVRHRPATFEWDRVELKRAVKAGEGPEGVFIGPGKVRVKIGDASA